MIINRNGTDIIVEKGLDRDGGNFWKLDDWESDMYPVIKNISLTCHTFVDIGAYIGPYTLYSAKHFRKVISVEPDKTIFKELKHNVELNGFINVELINCAVSNYNGTLKIGKPDENAIPTFALQILSEISKKENLQIDEVPCITLRKLYEDRGLSDGTFLKIDIEGSEYNLFDDIDFFEKNRPLISLEIHPVLLTEEQTNILNVGLRNIKDYYKSDIRFADPKEWCYNVVLCPK